MKGELRKEKICLNCGAEVTVRYCSQCGQENREARESFGELLYHFFSDFTHFDSKFFKTIKDLVIHPGFLTKEYLAGRRMRYLHPIRMYIFISFLFFIILGIFNVNFINNQDRYTNSEKNARAIQDLRQEVDKLKASKNPYDSTTIINLQNQINTLESSDEKNMTLNEYDSLQQTLPQNKQLTGIGGFFLRRLAKGKALYGPRYSQMMVEKFMHDIPKAMFFLLPLFALFLKWCYRKGNYYSDHAIFSLHFHSLAFLLMLVTLLLDEIFRVQFFESYIILILFIYLVLALKNVYGRSLIRSLFKAAWISMLYSISILIVLSIVGVIVFATM